MLFRKFVFVLYVLFCDAWFLLGSYYGTSYRFVPLVSMFASLSSICVITLFQLQAMFARERLTDDEKWSTVLWSCLHMFISLLFFVDGLEWANLFVVFCMAGLTMTLVIFIVAPARATSLSTTAKPGTRMYTSPASPFGRSYNSWRCERPRKSSPLYPSPAWR